MAIYMDEIKSQLKASLAQHLAATNVVIDGETLRARVRAAEIQGRLEDMVRWCHDEMMNMEPSKAGMIHLCHSSTD